MAQRDVPHLMNDDEWALWQSARAKPSPAAEAAPQGSPKAKPPKLTSARLNQMLLSSARSGDSREIASLLAQGASPNARERSAPRRSAAAVAMDNGNPQAALALIKAGGWAAPHEWCPGNTAEYDANIAAGPLCGSALDAAIAETVNLFFVPSSSWAVLLEAARIAQQTRQLETLSHAHLLRKAVGLGLWRMAADAMDSGMSFDESCWERAASALFSPFIQMPDSALSILISTLMRPQALAHITSDACEALFKLSIRLSSKKLLESLLDARLRPSADWMIHTPKGYLAPHRRMPSAEESNPDMIGMSLVTACSIDPNNGDLFKLASTCPPALAAARLRKVSPWRLRDMSIGRLQELADLGIPIDAADCSGQSLFHVWAATDASPRSGWATMARKFPNIFSHLDHKGRTGAQAMAQKLSPSEAQNFGASLARVEAREIRQAVGRAPAKKSTASKPRL